MTKQEKIEEEKNVRLLAECEEVIKALDQISNEDENLAMLEEAMEYYCGTWDKCEGYRFALKLTLRDQYENHLGEQDDDDLVELKRILGIEYEDTNNIKIKT